jgi:hypothetical protein
MNEENKEEESASPPPAATSAPIGKGGGGSRSESPSRRAETSATTGTGDEKVKRSSITASAAESAGVVSKPDATAGTSANERTKSGTPISSKAGAVWVTASDEKNKIMKAGDGTTLVSASAKGGGSSKAGAVAVSAPASDEKSRIMKAAGMVPGMQGGGSRKAGAVAVSAPASDEKSRIVKAAGMVPGMHPSSQLMEEGMVSAQAADSGARVAGGMLLAEQNNMQSMKDGMQLSSPLMKEEGVVSEQAVSSRAGVAVAEIVDEEELEAQYQENMIANAVAADIVDEDEFKESGRYWKISCCCILIIAIVCAIAIPLSKKAPTEQGEYDYLYDLVKELSGDALDDNSTAAYQALQWLAFEDPAELPIKESNETVILQRYAAAVFYYSTGGDLWTSDLNAMSNSTLCDWNDGGIGFICVDGDPAVKQLIISEFISRCYVTFCLLLPYTNVCPAFF